MAGQTNYNTCPACGSRKTRRAITCAGCGANPWLTDGEREEILRLRDHGFSYEAIGARLGRGPNAVYRACRTRRVPLVRELKQRPDTDRYYISTCTGYPIRTGQGAGGNPRATTEYMVCDRDFQEVVISYDSADSHLAERNMAMRLAEQMCDRLNAEALARDEAEAA